MAFPYEFLLHVPYGQAGNDLILNATVTEKRLKDARTVALLAPVTVTVIKDETAPEISIIKPSGSDSRIAEKRFLFYQLNIEDNVLVASAQVSLAVDRNKDGSFSDNETITNKTVLIQCPTQSHMMLKWHPVEDPY